MTSLAVTEMVQEKRYEMKPIKVPSSCKGKDVDPAQTILGNTEISITEAVDKTRNMEHSGTFRNIPEYPGTSRNIPEHPGT